METLWSGTPGAAKKVSVRKLFLNRFVRPSFYEISGRINGAIAEYWGHFTFGSACDRVSFVLSDGFYRQVKQISGAHNKAEANPLTKTKKRRGSARGMAPCVVSFFLSWQKLCPFSTSFFSQQCWWTCHHVACTQSPPLRPNTPPCRFWGSYINYRHLAVLINYLNIILVYYLAAIDKVCELVAATIVFLYSENWDWKHMFLLHRQIFEHRFFLAGLSAERHGGFVSGSAHPHLLWGCRWVRNSCYLFSNIQQACVKRLSKQK